jgi:hypothetical protein
MDFSASHPHQQIYTLATSLVWFLDDVLFSILIVGASFFHNLLQTDMTNLLLIGCFFLFLPLAASSDNLFVPRPSPTPLHIHEEQMLTIDLFLTSLFNMRLFLLLSPYIKSTMPVVLHNSFPIKSHGQTEDTKS